MSFNADEQKRYSRHFLLNDFGKEAQQRLKAAKVLCVGAGGLASPLLLYLAAAGVGTIGIIDDDRVDLSNLQRQVLYSSSEIGKNKVELARDKLKALNPNCQIIIFNEKLNNENALSIFERFDLITDATDNFATRYLINDACFQLKKPNVYASVFQFEGQCSVFNAEGGPCYRCLFPEPPPEKLIPNCATGGVLGALPGVMGAIQATEIIKLITKIGEPLIGRMLLYDALKMKFREVKINKKPDCKQCSLLTVFLKK